MSIFTKVGNSLHNNLIESAGSTLVSSIGSGAATGALLEGGYSIHQGNPVAKSLATGALKGTIGHGAYKLIGNQYLKGVVNTIDKSVGQMTNSTTRKVRSDFNISHFTGGDSRNAANISSVGQVDLKNIAFQNYNNI